ncbi:MAG: hypothetical protein HUU54_08815 [Ignavibacteriaceae bacterium]|nr:hypothetical protein [Ignavibacteriaceae bacterium]
MFLWLLLSGFLVSVTCALIVIFIFRSSLSKTLVRVVGEELAGSWKKFIQFALFVVGISGGVKPWNMERYLSQAGQDTKPLILTQERWVLELYMVVIDTIVAMSWMLFVYFLFSLITIGIIRIFEMKSGKQ